MSDARRFFDAIAGRYERAYGLPTEESRRRLRRVIDLLPPAPSSVLDLGVGPGRELSTLLDAGYQPTGLDVSPAMLDRCARRARPVPLVEADFWDELPFAAGTFDAAIALHGTLAHPPSTHAITLLGRELERVLRPGGTWIIEVPSPSWLERSEGDARVKRTGPRTGLYEDPVTQARIETRLLSSDEWRSALGSAWSVAVESTGDSEWLVVARPAR